MIPAEAVEAAGVVVSSRFPRLDQRAGQVLARELLEAAAPHLLAEAWEAGHNHCFHVEDPRNKERNPYRGAGVTVL